MLSTQCSLRLRRACNARRLLLLAWLLVGEGPLAWLLPLLVVIRLGLQLAALRRASQRSPSLEDKVAAADAVE